MENLINFTDLTPASAREKMMAAHKASTAEVARIENLDAPDWQAAEDLMTANEAFSLSTYIITHMADVASTPEWDALQEEADKISSDYYTTQSQSVRLFSVFEKLQQLDGLTPEQKFYIDETIRDFKLAGVNLPDDKKAEIKMLAAQLAELAVKYSQNILKATDAIKISATEDELSGVSDSTKKLLGADGGYEIHLNEPIYRSLMKSASNRALREKMAFAWKTRASELSDGGKFDNAPLMKQILQNRQAQARLLGFHNYIQRVLQSRIASSESAVIKMEENLAALFHPVAEREYKELENFAAEKLGLSDLQAWDTPFASDKMQMEKFGFSEDLVRKYFPVELVLDGLFAKMQSLYGAEFRMRAGVSVWHPDVKFYEVFLDGNLIGGMYLDLFSRAGKQSGAWMGEFQARRVLNGRAKMPIVKLVLNVLPATDGEVATMSIDNIRTLFHEMGHGVHGLFSMTKILDQAGTNVEWDGVELPSQMHESFMWSPEFLTGISRHVETGEKIPDDLLKQIIASKNFMTGMGLVRQISLGMFDMTIHSEKFDAGADLAKTFAEISDEYDVAPAAKFERFANNFKHIFDGGYDVGYYSYMWADIMAADAALAIDADPALAQKFKTEILEVGGSRPMMDSWMSFMGREPDPSAILRINGIV